MLTPRVHLGLIAALAVALGFSLASSEAIGYPAAPVVSMGSNPLWSIGGDMGAGTHTVVTADDGDLVITDISMSSSVLGGYWRLKVQLSDGNSLANFSGENLNTRPLNRTLSSGLRIPQGDSLVLHWDGGHGGHSDYRYTLSGYYAQP